MRHALQAGSYSGDFLAGSCSGDLQAGSYSGDFQAGSCSGDLQTGSYSGDEVSTGLHEADDGVSGHPAALCCC